MSWRDNYGAQDNAKFGRRLEESEAARKALIALQDERVRQKIREIVRETVGDDPNV